MAYELPAEQFNALDRARPRILRSQQFRDHIVQQYKGGYESFWQTPLTHGDDALSMEQMQAVLNTAQATFITILTDSAKFVTFVTETYPEALLSSGTEGEADYVEALLPERFHSSPYEYEIGQAGITLLSLKPAWETPQE